MPHHEMPTTVDNPFSKLSNAQIGRLAQLDVTNMIADVTETARNELDEHPVEDELGVRELHTIYPRDPTLYQDDHREVRVIGVLNRFIYKQGNDAWIEAAKHPRRSPVGSDSHEQTRRKYMALKNRSASSLFGGERTWRRLGFGSSSDLTGILQFTPVLVVNYEAEKETRAPGGSMIAFASFKDREQGHRLAQATAATVETLSQVADSETMSDTLDRVDYNKLHIAREVDGSSDNMKKYAPSRMMAEATVTVAQVTSLLLADLDHVDVKQAMKSLSANGVYKFLSVMIPAGVIGPFATSGHKIRKDFALDQHKLANGEYALSKEFRDVLIRYHIDESLGEKAIFDSVRAGDYGLSSLADNPLYTPKSDPFNGKVEFRRREFRSLGCPASAKDIEFAVNLVAAHIR